MNNSIQFSIMLSLFSVLIFWFFDKDNHYDLEYYIKTFIFNFIFQLFFMLYFYNDESIMDVELLTDL